MKGGKLTFYMSNKPNKKRGVSEMYYPYSLSDEIKK